MDNALDDLLDDIDTLKAALASERQARREAEAQASASQALVEHLKLLIAKLRRELVSSRARLHGARLSQA